MKISVLLASRKKHNPNSNLQRFLDSLANNAKSLANFEVLVKFDDDDEHQKMSLPPDFNYKTLYTPRGLGYADVHKAYMDLLCMGDPESELFWLLADDVEVLMQDWDEKLFSIAEGVKGKTYVINTVTHINVLGQTKQFSIENVDICTVLSRKWVGILGNFGFTFAQDGFTSLMCNGLENRMGISREQYRYFMDLKVLRHGDEKNELPTDERWNGTRERVRKEMIDTLLCPQVGSLLDIKAEVIANSIRNG